MSRPTIVDINDWYNRNVVEIIEAKTPELSDSLGDYWQTPAETIMQLRGDCEDYAIAKLYTLLEYGYSPDEWEIRAVRLKGDYHGFDGQLINHAILVNNVNGWVLDNMSREIVTIDSRIDIAQTYATIRANDTPIYRQWMGMISRRNPDLDSKLIRSIFG